MFGQFKNISYLCSVKRKRQAIFDLLTQKVTNNCNKLFGGSGIDTHYSRIY